MTETGFCSRCFDFTVHRLCPICSDPDRDQYIIMVVEAPQDVSDIEQSGRYKGLYHVLHGAISPVKGISPHNLCIGELVTRVDTEELAEIILATHSNMEGEATAMYLQRNVLAGKAVKITRLARDR